MSAKSSGAAIGGILLACLGFFRRGCDDVVRVADDIPMHAADDYIIGADGRVVWKATDDVPWNASDEIADISRRKNAVPSEAQLLKDKQEQGELIRMLAKRKKTVRGESFVKDLHLIAKRSTGRICFTEHGTIDVSFGLPALGKAIWIGTGVSIRVSKINDQGKVKYLNSECFFEQGICCGLRNGKLVIDRVRSIECEHGSLSVGMGAISFEAGNQSLALPLAITDTE